MIVPLVTYDGVTPAELVGSWAAPIAGFIMFLAVVLLGFAMLRMIGGR